MNLQIQSLQKMFIANCLGRRVKPMREYPSNIPWAMQVGKDSLSGVSN